MDLNLNWVKTQELDITYMGVLNLNHYMFTQH